MPNYHRAWRQGGTWFFTVALSERHGNKLLIENVDLLRKVVVQTQREHPFIIHGWVVLPDHIHCIWALPPNDSDFALRWRLIKARFSHALPATERRNASRIKRGERGIWQRRYWEHLLRDQADFNAHLNYVHINPVKHGLVKRVAEWPYSTFHRYVAAGIYPENLGSDIEIVDGDFGE